MRLRVKHEAPKVPKHDAFPYQVDAVNAIKDLEYAAIFHEQGLGKTKIGVDLALTWLQSDSVDSVLFLTKKSLVQNWIDEIKFHCHFRPRVIGSSPRETSSAINSPARLYIAHYEAVVTESRRLESFLKTRRVGVICDEAQKFKNPTGRIAASLFQLRERFSKRVVMTGTPVANRPFDIWSLIYFLDAGKALGADFDAFETEFNLTNELAEDAAARRSLEDGLAALMPRLGSFAVRETKATAGIELPGKQIRKVKVDLEERQMEIYVSYRDELRSVVLKDGIPVEDNADSIVKRLLRLVQVASNPRLVDTSYRRSPGKLSILERTIDEAIIDDPDAKVIVWTSFTENVDWLYRELIRFQPARVHGRLAIRDRNEAIARFKRDPDCQVLIATPGAAKEGLTLTVANHAVFFDRSLSLDDYLQAQDRIHRISQSKPCIVYNLIANETVDEWVDELLTAKQLAAKLSLGDTSLEEYQSNATYGFAAALRRVLGG